MYPCDTQCTSHYHYLCKNDKKNKNNKNERNKNKNNKNKNKNNKNTRQCKNTRILVIPQELHQHDTPTPATPSPLPTAPVPSQTLETLQYLLTSLQQLNTLVHLLCSAPTAHHPYVIDGGVLREVGGGAGGDGRMGTESAGGCERGGGRVNVQELLQVCWVYVMVLCGQYDGCIGWHMHVHKIHTQFTHTCAGSRLANEANSSSPPHCIMPSTLSNHTQHPHH